MFGGERERVARRVFGAVVSVGLLAYALGAVAYVWLRRVAE